MHTAALRNSRSTNLSTSGARATSRPSPRRADVVLADFYADWCGPCQMLEPVLEGLAAETDAAIAKIDVDDQQELAGVYGVRGVPTLALFTDGEQVEQHTGALPADRLRDLIGGDTD